MIQHSPSIALSLLCACLALQGCSSVKKTLGIERDPPNEYAVTPGAEPLEMPPDFFLLPPPVPGMERPQERAARDAQAEKFLGAAQEKSAVSEGQKHLLEMSGAETNQDNIRYEIDTEARMDVKKDPTIIEKLGLKKEKPKGEALNPYEEKARLEQEQAVRNPSATQQLMPPRAQHHAQQQRNETKTGNIHLIPGYDRHLGDHGEDSGATTTKR